jgi:hypothetical protein
MLKTIQEPYGLIVTSSLKVTASTTPRISAASAIEDGRIEELTVHR